NGSNCMWGVVKGSGLVTGNTGCGYTGNLQSAGSFAGARLRCLPSGFCGVTAVVNASNPQYFMVASPGNGPWPNVQSMVGALPNGATALSLVELNNVTYSLGAAISKGLYFVIDGGTAPQIGTPLNNATDAELFIRRDGSLAVIYTRPGGATPWG